MISPIISLEKVLRDYPNAKFYDVRYSLDGSNGHTAYLTGHIPSAIYVSMDHVLAGPPGPIVGRHPLPSPEQFAVGLGKLGIEHDDIVIAYDAVGGRFAGRLVWMLRVLGEQAAILNGGLEAWQQLFPDRPLATDDAKPTNCSRRVIDWPKSEIVTSDELEQQFQSGCKIFDSRAPERYRGDVEPLDPKAGHIPGAANLPFGGNYRDGGNFMLTPEELAERFAKARASDDSIFYCGSGVTACNNVLAAEAAGLRRPRLYVGSWSGWSSEDRPIATGDEPNGPS